MPQKLDLEARRRARLRYQLRQKSGGRARLSVFRSSQHIYAQIIDDKAGRTLAAASSIEKDLRGSLKTGADKDGRLGRGAGHRGGGGDGRRRRDPRRDGRRRAGLPVGLCHRGALLLVTALAMLPLLRRQPARRSHQAEGA